MDISGIPDVLAKIVDYKREEVRALKARQSLLDLEQAAKAASEPKGFEKALIEKSHYGPAIIAEVKKASPSKGLIRADFNPVNIATSYEKGGAACLSVLTDGPGFQGSNEIFKAVRDVSPLPMLRKDFMLDPVQIYESRAMGADCVLIILAMIDDSLAKDLTDLAGELDMDALLEVHTQKELGRALSLNSTLLGINNRDLRTFDTTLETFKALSALAPHQYTLIAESGIFTSNDVDDLTHHGANGFLIGESLMRQDDVEQALRTLTGEYSGNS